MRRSDLPFFRCLACRGDLALTEFVPGDGADSVAEGVLACTSCKTIYPVTEGIPFLLDLGYCADFDSDGFSRRWQGTFDFGRFAFFRRAIKNAQMHQLTFYNEDVKDYDDQVAGSAFWRAADANILGQWAQEIPPESLVLDLGCGTGRCAVPLARSGCRVIATDLSIGMLRKAIRTTRAAGVGEITYFLADAEALALKPDSFAVVLSYGMLHHVNEPKLILQEVQKVLTDGGRFYALENHASSVRFVFDLMMRARKLWNEEAGSSPLFAASELEDLARAAGLVPRTETKIFLPPHLMNLVGFALAKRALALTDRLCSGIPILRTFGGQVVLTARKSRRGGP